MIGDYVRTNTLSFPFSPERRVALVNALQCFTAGPSYKLKDWKSIVVLLFPVQLHCTSSSLGKTRKKIVPLLPIYADKQSQGGIQWLAESLGALKELPS